jgi:hypothetical protein
MVMMKKCTTSVLTVLALLACQPAHAGRITMQLTEQEETANGKTLCRYENSIYSFSYVTRSKHCRQSKPSTRRIQINEEGRSQLRYVAVAFYLPWRGGSHHP